MSDMSDATAAIVVLAPAAALLGLLAAGYPVGLWLFGFFVIVLLYRAARFFF